MGLILTLPVSFVRFFTSDEEDKAFTFQTFLIFLCLKFWRWMFKPRFNVYDLDSPNLEETGIISKKSDWKWEIPQDDKHLEKAVDEILFYGVNSKNECLMVRIARNDDQTAEAWLYLHLSNGKSYILQETTKTTDDHCFNAAGLRIQCLLPLRIWRIFFNGLLKDGDDFIHVKFSFIWSVLSSIYDVINDVDLSSLASSLTNIPWSSSSYQQLRDVLNMYEQAGQIRGTIKIEDNDEAEMYLWGTKLRMLGKPDMLENGKFYNVFGHIENGILFHIGYGTINDRFVNLQHGHVVEPTGHLFPIVNCHRITTGTNTDDPLMKKKFRFIAGQRDYGLKLISSVPAVTFSSARWSDDIQIKLTTVEMNGKTGRGIIIAGKFKESSKLESKQVKPPFHLSTKCTLNKELLVVPFAFSECQDVNLTGGKGSSLGKLMNISKDSDNFIVPNGIVITTTAYEAFIEVNQLKIIISALEDVAWTKAEGNLQKMCEKVVDKITESSIPSNLHKTIEQQLHKLYNERLHSVRFAIRSSASGEDSDDLSAAGQMDTFLNVIGLNEIMTAVKKCWASQFSFVATEYKRQNGQLLNTPMAVVIQEMVDADAAGVMFTCDPVTSNPKYITITANYGLGESVVSAKAEPDIITLKRNSNQQLSVYKITIGKKDIKIIMDDNGGVKEEKNIDIDCCSITDEQALSLGKVGLELENEFAACRDIEWCFSNGKLYLLQSRPITSITTETDFEITHELNLMFRCENECLSKGNIGEVMPDATSPLGLTFLQKYFGLLYATKSWRRQEGCKLPDSPLISKGITSIYNHIMFVVVDAWFRHGNDKDSAVTKAFVIAAIGKMLDDDNLFKQAEERYGDRGSLSSKYFNTLFIINAILFAEKKLNKYRKEYFSYQIHHENFNTSTEFHNEINRHWIPLFKIVSVHGACSFLSAIYNTVLMAFLANIHGEWNNEVYANFAYLLSSCSNIESADVPASMEKLAHAISKEIKPSEFKAMDVEEALKWLQTSSSNSSIEFKKFIKRHGHRGLKEFDLYSKPWRSESRPLIKILQDLIINLNSIKNKNIKNIEEIVKNLSLSLDWKKKLFLKFVISKCRHAVSLRERTKSIMIKTFDIMREAHCHLAKMMVKEGRLPDEELLFFLSYDEIPLLLEARSPRIIAKAIRRRKIHPELNRMKFPEIIYGIPKPINSEVVMNGSCNSLITMKGIPVSCGIAKGTAKVILHLEDAHNIKPGDILITYCTDIGWSPYFPLLGGVVTEIGGLISHGAVVAREYGLPGVVAIPGVTANFHTGDQVLIDGNRGIVQKLDTNIKT